MMAPVERMETEEPQVYQYVLGGAQGGPVLGRCAQHRGIVPGNTPQAVLP